MTSAELTARLRALRERLLAERPSVFRFDGPGSTCSGAFVKFDGAVNHDGDAVQTLLYTDEDDQLRVLWLYHRVLQEEIARLELQPGQLFSIVYRGQRKSAQGRRYHDYAAVTEDEDAEFALAENSGPPYDDPPF